MAVSVKKKEEEKKIMKSLVWFRSYVSLQSRP